MVPGSPGGPTTNPRSISAICSSFPAGQTASTFDANKYVHPESHPASMITQDTDHRFVTDTEKNKIGVVTMDRYCLCVEPPAPTVGVYVSFNVDIKVATTPEKYFL